MYTNKYIGPFMVVFIMWPVTEWFLSFLFFPVCSSCNTYISVA